MTFTAVKRLLLVTALMGFMSANALAQKNVSSVRNVDDPARAPYFFTLPLACSSATNCLATFPVVQAGKRLRLTSLRVIATGQFVAGSLAVHRNIATPDNLYFLAALGPMNVPNYTPVWVASHTFDLIFDAGEQPIVAITTSDHPIQAPHLARIGVTGYLIDIAQ
jgi:hypothetical protein